MKADMKVMNSVCHEICLNYYTRVYSSLSPTYIVASMKILSNIEKITYIYIDNHECRIDIV